MYIIRCICLWMILGLMACSGPVRIQKNLEVKPEIFPDYADVTIPPNIAAFNFKLKTLALRPVPFSNVARRN